jgi:hypothetical protein
MSEYDDAVRSVAIFIEEELFASSGDIKAAKELVKQIVKDAVKLADVQKHW